MIKFDTTLEVNTNIINKLSYTLSNIQKTNFPISYDEQSSILRKYINYL